MDDMMQLTQIRQQALREEADIRRLVKLANKDQQPRRANHTFGIGRIIQMALVMLK
jgi:glycerate kinase